MSRKLTRRAFLAAAAAIGGSVLVWRELPAGWFRTQQAQPLVVLKNGSVADGIAAVLGQEHVRWKGKEVVGLHDCDAYAFSNRGLRFRIDREVLKVPASELFPEPGLHLIEWVVVDKEGNEFEPPLISFTALFT